MATLTFAHVHSYGTIVGGVRTGIGQRAYAWFQIVDPTTGRRSRREFGLIDSGCERTFLDAALVPTSAGWRWGPAIAMTAAGGAGLVGYEVLGAELEIEGVLASITPVVGTTTTSIIGSEGYSAAFDIAFTGVDWMHS